jgi:RNA-directed DNA polymerase
LDDYSAGFIDTFERLAYGIAGVLIYGGPAAKMKSRVDELMGHRWAWAPSLVRRYKTAFPADQVRPRRRDVVQFLLADKNLRDVYQRSGARMRLVRWTDHSASAEMRPVGGNVAQWPCPAIVTVGDLAEWLSITVPELEWFADLKGLSVGGSAGKLEHYRYTVLEKRQGAGRLRLIESPKPRLKELQRRILTEILDRIPAHPAVHGFVRGRSIKTFAAPHAGKQTVLRMDLRDFFPSIYGVRIQSLFRTAGYPEAVADLLGGLCTNVVPRSVWRAHAAAVGDAPSLYATPHLPQGAPTSPALANLCAYRADCRLAGLAAVAGAVYTRYADDLAFSTENPSFDRSVERFASHVAAILQEEGFHVHHRKTRVMRQGVRQHLAGLVVNEKVNVYRGDFDELKAILTNCVRHGAESQNREGHPAFRAHLEGRVGFVGMVQAAKGAKLRAILDRIVWAEG